MLPVSPAVRADTTHVGGEVQVAFISVSALSGVGPSATVELPPPTFRPPHPSVLRTVPLVPPERTEPQGPPGAPVMNRRVRGAVGLVVELALELVVVLRLVLVVVVLLVDVVLVSELLVEVVVDTTEHDATTP